MSDRRSFLSLNLHSSEFAGDGGTSFSAMKGNFFSPSLFSSGYITSSPSSQCRFLLDSRVSNAQSLSRVSSIVRGFLGYGGRVSPSWASVNVCKSFPSPSASSWEASAYTDMKGERVLPCWASARSFSASALEASPYTDVKIDASQHCDEVAKLSKIISKTDWSRAVDALENLGIRLTAVHVVDVIKLEKNPKHALRFFIWAGQQKGYVHNAFAINAITRVWGHERDFKIFLDILANMHLDNYSMTPAKYLVLIKGYGWAGLTDAAMDIFNWMIKTGRKPNEKHFSCLLALLLKENQFQKAQSILEKMKQVGVPLDVVTYTTLIDGACKAGQIQIACNHYFEMIQNGIQPNALTYGALFDGLCKANEVDKALKVLEDVKDTELDTAVLNTFMSGLCDNGRVETAHDFFMKSGHKPDARTYAILVGGLCKVKNFRDAEKFTEQALAKGLVFEVATCAALLESLCLEARGKEACALMNRLLNHGNIPDATCNMVLASLSRSGEAYSAFKLWNDILRYKNLSGDSYQALLDGLCKEGRLTFAEQVYFDMMSKGCEPTVGVLGALLDGFCRAGSFDEAYKVLNGMMEKGCAPNGDIFNSLIHGLSKAGKVLKAVQVLEMMESSDCIPNIFTYVSLINGFCKIQSPENALTILKKMLARGFAPDVGTYSTLINTLCKVKKADVGYDLFVDMKQRGYVPSVAVFDALIGGLCQLGRVDDAHKLLLQMLETGRRPNKAVCEAVVLGLGKLERTEDVSKLMEVLG